MPSDSSPETTLPSAGGKLRVIIAGAGSAGLETALALCELAPGLSEVTMIAPDHELVYRPMTVREPFAYAKASRYPLAEIARDAGAKLIEGRLAWIDPGARRIQSESGEEIEYDALMLALGASIEERYPHALTIDDRDLDETLHGLIQDIEGDFVHRLAFVVPSRMAWPLPLYELALMIAARAYDTQIELQTTIVTSEESPLAVFGQTASDGVAELLGAAGIETISAAHAEIPSFDKVVIDGGARHLEVDRVIALPQLNGPPVRGIPLGEDGFIEIDSHCRVPGVERIYAAGDATAFPIKMGGIGAQQADSAAQSIAALAGAPLTPGRFDPTLQGILLGAGKPRYLSAHIVGGAAFDSEIEQEPSSSSASKIAAKYLAPYLRQRDQTHASATSVTA